jgi:uncharacterized membrane protein
MKNRTNLETQVQSWVQAGLIDANLSARILAFEAGQERRASLNWPVIVALTFGGILLAAGITLFVAAHWDELSPAVRFALVLFMVAAFHGGGALAARRFAALSTTLHAIGTMTLGAAIYLTAQIFNLHENWATGILLWTLGAAIGFLLLRDWPQATALALLAPAWLISQWSITTQGKSNGSHPLAMGLLLTALSYLSARAFQTEGVERRVLAWIGGISLLPCAAIAVGMVASEREMGTYLNRDALPAATMLVGWIVALGAPIAIAFRLRGRAAWPVLGWAVWAYLFILAANYSEIANANGYRRSLLATLALYILCALGSIALVAWGLFEKRRERVNLGVAAFAISVLFFYFDSFMGKMDRSLSLVLLGMICLAGGYALEMTRRKLMFRMKEAQ